MTWKDHYKHFPEDQQCVVRGEQCTGKAVELHHGLHGRRDKDRELKMLVDQLVNAVPVCHNCNFLRHADREWAKCFEFLLDQHGLEAIIDWAKGFPNRVKIAGTEWYEMMDRIVKYSLGKEHG